MAKEGPHEREIIFRTGKVCITAAILKQIPLEIVSRLAYDPERFLLHAGLREELERALFVTEVGNLRLCLIHGGPRSGKTHLSLRLAREYSRQGQEVSLLSGEDFALCISRSQGIGERQVLIVDDADAFLSTLAQGDSGLFVRFVEHTRVQGGALVLLLSGDLSQFGFDEHVRSRLASAVICRIGNPGEDDMPELVRCMARQRGLFLTDRKICFLARRLRREIAAIDNCLWQLEKMAGAGESGGINFSALTGMLIPSDEPESLPD